jgi:hypothetical protein
VVMDGTERTAGMGIPGRGKCGRGWVRVVAARTGSFCGKAMTADDIYTVAGDGTSGFAGDGGPAIMAELSPRRWGWMAQGTC